MSDKLTYEELEARIRYLERAETERGQAMAALRDIENRFRGLAENSPDTIYRMTIPDGRYEYVSAASASVFGYPPEDWYENPVFVREILHPDWVPYFERMWDELLKGRVPESFEYRIVHKDGSFRWIHQRNAAVRGPSGELVAIEGVATDITKRKDAENSLVEMEEKYRELVEHTPGMICSFSPDYTITFVNKAYCDFFKRNPEELTGRKFLELIPEADHQAVTSRISSISANAPFQTHEHPVIGVGGKIRWHRWTNRGVFDNQGNIVGYKSVGEDITERKRVEKALRESEERFRALSDATFEAIFISEKGICIDQNVSAEKMFGFTLSEAIGRHGTEWIAPADRATVKEKMMQGYEKPYEVNALRKDGSTFPCEIQARMFSYQERNVRITALRDITVRKQAEKAIRESERRLRAIMDNSAAIIYIKDKKGLFRMVNREFERSFHVSEKDIIGKSDRHLMPPELSDVYGKNDREVLEKGTAMKFEETAFSDNKAHTALSVKFPLVDDQDHFVGICGISTDITDRIELEDKLRQSQKMEAIGTLAGGVAHEFNNILGIILGHAELALDDIPEWNPAYEWVKEILNASLRAKDVVRKLLSFARKTPESRVPVRIGTIVEESLDLIRKTVPASVDIRPEILCTDETILADPMEIAQVLLNLCVNSAHAMPEETGILHVVLEAFRLDGKRSHGYEDLPAGNYVKLTVEDTGEGIVPENLGRIFEPYFTTKDVDQGLGMGLAVVQGIVKKHDGAIKVESQLGKGTAVEVLFPLAEKHPADISKRIASPSTGTGRILFVDDETSIVKMVVQILGRIGYETIGKTSSADALEAFKEAPGHFDLVISDMAMPEMPGDRLVRELIRIRPDIPVILCTGHSDRVDKDKARELGVKAFARKPLERAYLAETIRKVLDESANKAQG